MQSRAAAATVSAMHLYVVVKPLESYYAEGPAQHALYNVRIERAVGQRSLIVPYQEFGPELVRDLDPRAIVMSGFGPRFEDLDRRDFYGMEAVMKTGERPILCICGSHQEVKRLPPGFDRIAESGHCRIEAMKDRERCLYAVQFHPEQHEAPFPHGRRILENFAAIVKRFWRS